MTFQRAILRPYQQEMKEKILRAWTDGARNVLAVLPTGSGKTVTFSDILHDHEGTSCAVAHRQELVCQISIALARDAVRHRIIGPQSVVRLCVRLHMEEIGESFYDAAAKCAVAGVDTLVSKKRQESLKGWTSKVTLWVQDEAHHVLTGNKWGRAAAMFPNARGLGVTATPVRADGKGLGRDYDGVFDVLIIGHGMRHLIEMGYLTDYRIFAPPSDLDLSQVKISATTGDYVPEKLKLAVRKSHVVGDVVSHYKRIADGKLGVTFASDVETATDIARSFNDAGVPAEVVSAKTPDSARVAALRRFRNQEISQLVNVDLFGEGFDLPAIEVVSMARPTQSFNVFAQQFGRSLRTMEGKERAIVIDHVNNVITHGLPDSPRVWSLARRQKRSQNGNGVDIPLRACPECTGVYENVLRVCPYCGFVPIPQSRQSIEFVDGDLTELSPEALQRMRGEIDLATLEKERYRAYLAGRNVPHIGQLALVKKHVARRLALGELCNSISWWAGFQRAKGRDDSENYRRFFFRFGVDVLSAQALKEAEARELKTKIDCDILKTI